MRVSINPAKWAVRFRWTPKITRVQRQFSGLTFVFRWLNLMIVVTI